ncbi:putative beta-lysine N-acetyltransferase [candidate division KSB1 bacterium]|nr:putative beta-lysine N-acetyltransferase [candidate division KSB1 bacterium]
MDKVEKIGASLIQHGKLNDRIYLMRLSEREVLDLPSKLINLAKEKKYTKIFAKVPSPAVQHFQKYDFFKEAYVPNFFHGKTGLYFLAKYIDPNRAEIPLNDRLEIHKIIQLTKTKRDAPDNIEQENVAVRQLDDSDITILTQLFKSVFKTYPFPIFDGDYIKETMTKNTRYFGAFDGEKLVAAASADIDFAEKNVEMTDFAVTPAFRTNNLALLLLQYMEDEMRKLDLNMLYTIARALSPAMNITFAKAGYYFAGTLKNNTNIGGKIESMNVWYKFIKDQS